MVVHYHRPSRALAMAKQSQGYWIHLDYKHIRGKQIKTKLKKKKKLRFDSNNNERKYLLTPLSPSVQACSHSSMKLVSPLSYINESKNYIKEKNKTYTKKNEKLA